MGGDCLNYGCVPSKALLAAGRAAAQYGHTSDFGVHGSAARVDFIDVHAHVHGVIASIAPHDSVARFEVLGVQVFKETARAISRAAAARGCGRAASSLPPVRRRRCRRSPASMPSII